MSKKQNHAKKDTPSKKEHPMFRQMNIWGLLFAVVFTIVAIVKGIDSSALLLVYAVCMWTVGALTGSTFYFFAKGFKNVSESAKDMRKKDGSWSGVIMILVVVGLILAIMIAPIINAQNAIDETARVCSEYGLGSSECSKKESQHGVSCSSKDSVSIKCEKKVRTSFPIFAPN